MREYGQRAFFLLCWIVPLNMTLVLTSLLFRNTTVGDWLLIPEVVVNFPAVMWLLGSGISVLKTEEHVNWFYLNAVLSVPCSIMWALAAATVITFVKWRKNRTKACTRSADAVS